MLWLQTLLYELKVSSASPVIFCDNESTVAMAHNPILHARTKHMLIDLFFVWEEKVLAKQMQAVHIPGTDKKADIPTKPLLMKSFFPSWGCVLKRN